MKSLTTEQNSGNKKKLFVSIPNSEATNTTMACPLGQTAFMKSENFTFKKLGIFTIFLEYYPR